MREGPERRTRQTPRVGRDTKPGRHTLPHISMNTWVCTHMHTREHVRVHTYEPGSFWNALNQSMQGWEQLGRFNSIFHTRAN